MFFSCSKEKDYYVLVCQSRKPDMKITFTDISAPVVDGAWLRFYTKDRELVIFNAGVICIRQTKKDGENGSLNK